MSGDPDALLAARLAGGFLAPGAAGPPAEPLVARARAWLRRRDDLELAAEFRAACPVPGREPRDYAPRLLEPPGLGPVLVGIRFFGGDLAWPFVELIAAAARPGEGRLLPGLLPLVAREYAPFGPRALRVLVPAPIGPADLGVPAEVDQRLLAGRLEELSRRPPPAAGAPLALWPADPSDYAGYRALYDRAVPAGRQRAVPPLDAPEWEEVARRGTLWEARLDGRRAGYVGARPGDFLDLAGWEVVEEVLDPALQGRGLGPALQRALIDRLDPAGRPWLWGTIDRDNAPSLATARRCGRVERWTHLFCPLGEDPRSG